MGLKPSSIGGIFNSKQNKTEGAFFFKPVQEPMKKSIYLIIHRPEDQV